MFGNPVRVAVEAAVGACEGGGGAEVGDGAWEAVGEDAGGVDGGDGEGGGWEG